MRFYSLNYSEIMELPIKTFWFMNSCIDRVKAQEDIRSLSVAVCGQGGEIAIDRREKLVLEMGTVVTIVGDGSNPLEAALDKSGLDDLKMMAGERIGQ